MAAAEALFIHHPDTALYKFSDDHPFHPHRLTLTIDLLEQCGALRQNDILPQQAAGEELLSLVHRPDYIRLVSSLSLAGPDRELIEEADKYGLRTEDTPYFPGMHHAASLIVGGTVQAAELVMSGRCKHAYHLAGGLHHAFPDKGAGFCVYNDAAVAIAHIRRRYGARVMYIDTDVHHGDGVQWVFYAERDVLTYSIHETGKFLFPGSGFVHERGSADGFGACCNVPVEPYTEDDSWLECFRYTVEKAAAAFKPDVIVSQHGCDAHAFDPLSHTQCSMQIYAEMPAVIHELAHRYAQGRWVAMGGGGYDVRRVVPRAWALVWLEMCGHPLAAQLRAGDREARLPSSWIDKWTAQGERPLPATWLDSKDNWQPMPRRAEITERNRATMQLAVQDF
ncbi:acetoin utilization protein AcuC [Paenibacillus tarimensis]|uniref:acetoin utilization protein AcuC n=1 Tax=Paenibacillus tarimensis TaxID=416012 RepID=UPI001F2BD699|nr:acetoin utilization protein AcuC [Paenibacillus tarimensis]MCF2942187.1 acetoin utilization protein AcuC [Paenibacillus tarimensis]